VFFFTSCGVPEHVIFFMPVSMPLWYSKMVILSDKLILISCLES
jgi:hypothetical protein